MARKVVKPIIRRNAVTPTIGGMKWEGRKLPTMVIVLRASEPGVRRKFKEYCNNPKHPIGYEEIAELTYVVCAFPETLMELATGRWWVRDWHWDHEVTVHGASGHGAEPKRDRSSKFIPTSKEGAQQLKAMEKENQRHTGAGKPKKPDTLHGDETLDRAQQNADNASAHEWKQLGLSPAKPTIGNSGKVL